MDIKQLILKIKNFKNLSKFIYERKDGGIVLGNKESNEYWLVYINDHNYTDIEEGQNFDDFYSICTNAKFGLNYEDFIKSSDQYIYQIYGINLPTEFVINEISKKTNDSEFFSSFFKDEIFDLNEGKSLLEEISELVNTIEKSK